LPSITRQALAPGSIEMRMELGFVHLKRNDRKKTRALMLQALEAAPGRCCSSQLNLIVL
jgi:hypothetical protein